MGQILNLTLAFICGAALAGCGGGGGGGSGDDLREGSASTGVRLLHAVIDAPPLEVVSSLSSSPVDTARFGERSFYGALSTGAQTLTVSPRLEPGRTLGSFGISVASGERRSIVIYGEEESGIQSALLDDAPGEIPAGQAVVRFVNGVASAGEIGVTITGGEAGVDLPQGGASFHQPVPPGAQTITVRAGERAIFSGARNFESGRAYTVLVAGEAGYFVTVTVFED